MARRSLIVAGVLFGTCLAAALPRAPVAGFAAPCTSSPAPSGGDANAMATANNAFGFALFDRLLAQRPSANTLVSPLSAATALEMTYQGARGRTAAAMAHVLALRRLTTEAIARGAGALLSSLSHTGDSSRLDAANSLWARQGVAFRRGFVRTARQSFSARVDVLDFRSPNAPTQINSWVSCATHGTITSIVRHIPPATVMYLLNAVYFAGNWQFPFISRSTHLGTFHTASGGEVRVPFMSQNHTFPLYRGDGAQITSLPYGSGRFDMVLILPPTGTSLEQFAAKLTPTYLTEWLAKSVGGVQVQLPRFQVVDSLSLKSVLSSMGMAEAFSRRADFGDLCASRQCTISSVLQKTYLKVTEKGTTAAAVTSVGVGTLLARPQLVVDRPFFLAIRDTRTSAVLFLSAVNDPT